MDQVTIQQIQCYGYHGVFPEENKLGQRFIVDLTLELDLRTAGKTDDLNLTVNYAEIAERIKDLVEGRPYQLLEALAEAIAASILANYSLVQNVQVAVTKPNPPVALPFAGVRITINRQREQ